MYSLFPKFLLSVDFLFQLNEGRKEETGNFLVLNRRRQPVRLFHSNFQSFLRR